MRIPKGAEVIDVCKAVEEMMNESEERGELRMLIYFVHKLKSLTRIESFEESQRYKEDVFLLPQTVRYEFSEDNLFDLKGISEKWDKKRIDLIRVIQVSDALNIKYQCTNVLTPLAYAESRKDILWHLNTQGVFVSKIVHGEILQWIKSESRKKNIRKA